jgi:hypothetical protein
MRSRDKYPLSVTILKPNDQPHVFGLPTAASAFLAVLFRQLLLVKIHCLGSFDFEAIGSVHDNQAMQLASTFRIDGRMGR